MDYIGGWLENMDGWQNLTEFKQKKQLKVEHKLKCVIEFETKIWHGIWETTLFEKHNILKKYLPDWYCRSLLD